MMVADQQKSSALISSDRVEGTAVVDANGEKIGSVKKLMIRKDDGQVTDAVLSIGGFLGIGSKLHYIPWSKLRYETDPDGYRLDVTEEQLREAPTYEANDRDKEYDRDYQTTVYEFWQVRPYW